MSTHVRDLKILMYHAICRTCYDPYALCVTPERFETQMRYLHKRGIRGVSMRTLLDARRAGAAEGLVGITFDDGYESVLRYALPVLEQLQFTATLFVLGSLPRTNEWDEQRTPPAQRMRLVQASDLRSLSSRGLEVGSHTMSHVALARVRSDLLAEEVRNSRRALSEAVGESVDGFCYPYGSLDKAAIEAVRAAGYTYACSVLNRPDGSYYDIARIPVLPRNSLVSFAVKVAYYNRYRSAKSTLRELESILSRQRGRLGYRTYQRR